MDFHSKRRQQFMGERHYLAQIALSDEVVAGQRENLGKPESGERGWHSSMKQGIALELFIKLCLHYTAGEAIEDLRAELEAVVAALEQYGEHLWKDRDDRNEPVFVFVSLDEYCQLMQLIGLCFLLHRRDLLPRVAALQDGEASSNGGADTLFEEFMIHAVGPERRFESEYCCHLHPYESLFYALTEDTQDKQLKELKFFLKRWYKDLAGTAWHNSHKPNEDGDQGGYYGYWSFEAGAAVMLLGIEDDSSLHKYLYYPKDLVAWSRANASLSDSQNKTALMLRALAGEPCPREGYWLTAARANSRRRFETGEAMPDVGGDYGTTIWQWDTRQTE